MDELDLQALLDAQEGYTQPTYQDYSEPDLSWFLNNTDFSGLDSTGQESDGVIDLTSLLNPSSSSGSILDSLIAPQYPMSVGAAYESPSALSLWQQDLKPAQSYVLSDGTVVGMTKDGADVQNPYDYIQGPDGQTYIVDTNTQKVVGTLDANLNNVSLQDLAREKAASSASGEKDYAAALKQLASKQALQQMKAKQAYADSGIGKALSGLSMAALLAKTLTGKNQAPKVSARANQGQAFAPTYQGASAPKTKYAFGGSVARSSGSRLNFPVNQPGFSANNPKFLGDSSDTWSNVLNTVRAPTRAPVAAPVFPPYEPGYRGGANTRTKYAPVAAPVLPPVAAPVLPPYEPGYRGGANTRTKYASGGEVHGGLLSLAKKMAHEMASQKGLIGGEAGGQDDVVDIKAAPGEYVMDAEVVSALGDGNNEEGARKLDQMRVNVRKHKRTGGLSSIPPKAKKPEQYMKKGK